MREGGREREREREGGRERERERDLLPSRLKDVAGVLLFLKFHRNSGIHARCQPGPIRV